MATVYDDIYGYEGTLVQSATTAHKRKRQYVSDGKDGGTDDSGIYGYYDDNYDPLSPNPAISRHWFVTLDDDLNPQHAIGEEGFFFRHSSSPTDQDLDLLLVDNDPGTRANWPKLWWDYSELAFSINDADLNIYGDSYISGSLGIGTLTPVSLMEIYDDDANPILTITAAHNTDYDPQIHFRVDGTPLVRAAIGVDANDNSFKINIGDPSAGVSDTLQFCFTDDGYLGIGTDNPDTYVHIKPSSAGSVASATYTVLTLESGEAGTYMQMLCPNGANEKILFGDTADNDIAWIQYYHTTNEMSFGTNTYERLKIDSSGKVGINMGATALSSILEVLGTTEQLRLRYDNTYYFASFTVAASGNLTISTYDNCNEANIVMNPLGTGYVAIGSTTPSSMLDVNGSVEINANFAYYLGDPTTEGSWRLIRVGNNLEIQRYESSTWTVKDTITP